MATTFIIISLFIAICAYIVKSFGLLNIQAFTIIAAIYTILPALIAWFSERSDIKTFCSEYITIKRTNWKRLIYIICATSVIYPLLVIGLIWLYNIFFNTSEYFSLELNEYKFFNLIGIDTNAIGGYGLAILLNLSFILIAGSIMGVINSIFEEIAWRGFLKKHIDLKRFWKVLITSIVWTIWGLAILNNSISCSIVIAIFVFNCAMSYYLDTIATATGSVWACSMVRGIVNLAFYCPLIVIVNNNVFTYISTASILLLAILTNVTAHKRPELCR